MDKPISFRICDFSEQLITHNAHYGGHVYSAVMHVDGKVLQYQKALSPRFSIPLAALRSEAWLNLLEQVAKSKS